MEDYSLTVCWNPVRIANKLPGDRIQSISTQTDERRHAMPADEALLITEERPDTKARQTDFEPVWRLHRPRIWRLVARLAGDTDLADDLTQEVSVRAFQAFADFRGKASASTWLYRIAINVVHRHWERRSLQPVSLDTTEVAALPADETAGPEAAALQAELRPVVWAALERLPEELRTTLILQIYEGLKYREIAEVLDIPIGTVKSRLNSAMQRLREELKEYAL